MPTSSDLEVRVMRRDEVDLAIDWAAREGWNPGSADADCFYAADPGGFLLGVLAGEPVGCISVVRYGDRFGFLGFYIVNPELRGRGFGLQIWEAGMARLQGRIVGLDGVIDQQDNYRRSGFVLAHQNIRFGGIPRCEPADDARLTAVHPQLAEAVVEYDHAFFPAARSTFLRCWLQPGARRGTALIENGTVRGYGVIRPCRSGFKIGPLFADAEEGADLLFRVLAAGTNGKPVFLDCPQPNRSATDLAIRYGLAPVFATARMYRGPAPNLPLGRTYGITTFELG
jgi:Acetyltransferase (GNAT) domain/Acetyltransferase (GNAT) family